MLRSTLLYLRNQQRIFDFVRHNALAKHLASRFVAGETVEEALDAVVALNAKGATASLDLLGESVTTAREARDSGPAVRAPARPHPRARARTRT
jgi:proline dehydrogenase